MRLLRPFVGLLLAVLLVGSACQASTRVTVTVRPAGDGDVTVTLRLDKEAAGRYPNIASLIKVGDLQRAGWVISPPAAGADGSVTVTAVRRFRSPAEAAAVFGQLTGPAGPLHTLHLVYRRSVVSTSTKLFGTLDLRGGVDAFADPGLAAQLGYPSLAGALTALRQAGGASPVLRVEVAARLPGGVDHAPGATMERGTAVWTTDFGQTVPILASSSRRNWLNLGLLAICALSLAGLALVGLTRLLGRGRPADGLQFGGRAGRGGRGGRGGRRGARRRHPSLHRRHRDSWDLPSRDNRGRR